MPRVHSITHYDGSSDDGWFSITCGHCRTAVSAAVLSKSYSSYDRSPTYYWLRCPNCLLGSVTDGFGPVWPPHDATPSVEGLPEEVANAFAEARISFAVGAYTACELMCRKILMHAA